MVVAASRRLLLQMVLAFSVVAPRRHEHSVRLRWRMRTRKMPTRLDNTVGRRDMAKLRIGRINGSTNKTVSKPLGVAKVPAKHC